MSDTLPTGQLSNVPWRRTGVKYTNNEAYFDVIEEIDAIIDKSGTTVYAEIQGYVSNTHKFNSIPSKYETCNCFFPVYELIIPTLIEVTLYMNSHY